MNKRTDTSTHKNSTILSDTGKTQCAVASLLEEMRIEWTNRRNGKGILDRVEIKG
jgi:hypothetical protein